MKITALVENFSDCELKAVHGLSFYIQTEKHKLLFDLGPDETLFENAKKMGVDLSIIDTVIISHGHMDHGGALSRFLKENQKATIYVQKGAFEQHYSKFLFFMENIGLDKKLMSDPRIILVDGDLKIDEELSLFTVTDNSKCHSSANDSLYEGRQRDNFLHEQNLVIKEKSTALIVGCGHTGIVNIMQKAKSFEPDFCFGGYHLYNPTTKKTVDQSLLSEIADDLKKYDKVQFFTCHCTGKTAYDYLASNLKNMNYISCGKKIEI